MKITKQGIEIETKYDDIIWLWWWKRKDKNRFLSFLTGHTFRNWKDIRKAWREYDHFRNNDWEELD